MMDDPELLTVVATAERLHMLPSEVRIKATQWDLVQMAALNKVRDEDWRKRYERDRQIERSKQMTDEEKAKVLFGGM